MQMTDVDRNARVVERDTSQWRARLTTPLAEFRRSLNEDAQHTLARFEQRCGVFGERERRLCPFGFSEIRDSGAGEGVWTSRGHASVFNSMSLDLGGFREKVARAAFDDVLRREGLDTHLLWDHSTHLALARTLSVKYPLELGIDDRGLTWWARMPPTHTAHDLRILMEGGVIDQASFAFTVAEDEWEIENEGRADERLIRTITKIGDLFDVTITAQGAYPQADSSVVRSYARSYAESIGRLTRREREAESEEVAPTAPQAETPEEPAVGPQDNPVAPSAGGNRSANTHYDAALAGMRHRIAQHRPIT
jgi:HK97 family phage prohead protease